MYYGCIKLVFGQCQAGPPPLPPPPPPLVFPGLMGPPNDLLPRASLRLSPALYMRQTLFKAGIVSISQLATRSDIAGASRLYTLHSLSSGLGHSVYGVMLCLYDPCVCSLVNISHYCLCEIPALRVHGLDHHYSLHTFASRALAFALTRVMLSLP